MSPLQTLVAAGLTVRADGARLVVSPAALLTDEIGRLIRDNKDNISADLHAAHELGRAAVRVDQSNLRRLRRRRAQPRCFAGGMYWPHPRRAG